MKYYNEEPVSVNIDPADCCLYCELNTTKDFDVQAALSILLKSITELESVLEKGKDGISETKLISWMRGAKRDWLAADSIQSKIDESSTYCKGNEIEGHVWSKDAWENVIRQSVKLGYVDICFNTFELKGQEKTITRTYRTYKLTSQGRSFLAYPVPVFVMSPFKNILNPKEAKQVVTRKRQGRGCHYLPRIKDMLKIAIHGGF